MKLNIKPRGRYVLVKPDGDSPRESKHGILTPTNVEQEKKTTGEVLGVGELIKDLKKGNRVVFGTYSGDPLNVDGVEYKLLHDDDILAKLE